MSSSHFCGIPACLPPGCNSVQVPKLGERLTSSSSARTTFPGKKKKRRNLEKLILENKVWKKTKPPKPKETKTQTNKKSPTE